jgi:hypothetical protein
MPTVHVSLTDVRNPYFLPVSATLMYNLTCRLASQAVTTMVPQYRDQGRKVEKMIKFVSSGLVEVSDQF